VTLRQKALDMLKSRRPFDGPLDRDWRTRAAWKYLQMSMGKPSCEWTDTPPPVTVSMPRPEPQRIAA